MSVQHEGLLPNTLSNRQYINIVRQEINSPDRPALEWSDLLHTNWEPNPSGFDDERLEGCIIERELQAVTENNRKTSTIGE